MSNTLDVIGAATLESTLSTTLSSTLDVSDVRIGAVGDVGGVDRMGPWQSDKQVHVAGNTGNTVVAGTLVTLSSLSSGLRRCRARWM